MAEAFKDLIRELGNWFQRKPVQPISRSEETDDETARRIAAAQERTKILMENSTEGWRRRRIEFLRKNQSQATRETPQKK